MTNSILDTIKKMLGIPTTDDAFDVDIIVNINSAFFVLHQLGVGPVEEPYHIEGSDETWVDFLTDTVYYNSVKTYIYLKVKQTFDPSGSTGYVLDSIDKQIKELEWRLCNQVPVPPVVPVVPEEP